MVTKLDRLVRNLRKTLNLFHELPERGIGISTLDDPLIIDTAADDAMSRVSVAMLGLLPEMERVYMLERTDRARAAALARVASPGPQPKLGVDDVERGVPRDVKELSMVEISDKTGVSVSTLYRRIPFRPSEEERQ